MDRTYEQDPRAFEAATFPGWTRWFSAASPEDVMLARDRSGAIAGIPLGHGPGAGAIGCVGVAPSRQGEGIGTGLVVRASEVLWGAGTRNCHIGWTTRESFTAAPATSPGDDMPCSPALPNGLRLPSSTSRQLHMQTFCRSRAGCGTG